MKNALGKHIDQKILFGVTLNVREEKHISPSIKVIYALIALVIAIFLTNLNKGVINVHQKIMFINLVVDVNLVGLPILLIDRVINA